MKNNKCFFSYILILLNLILGFVSFFYIFFWIRAGNSFLFTFCSEELFTFAWIITPWINLVLLFISLWQIFYKAVLFLCFLIGIIINLYLFFGALIIWGWSSSNWYLSIQWFAISVPVSIFYGKHVWKRSWCWYETWYMKWYEQRKQQR